MKFRIDAFRNKSTNFFDKYLTNGQHKKEEKEWICKPSSVCRIKIREAVITLDRLLPIGSVCRFPCKQATYPPALPGPGSGLFGLAGGGVCRAAAVASGAVRSYRTFSPLPVPRICFQRVRMLPFFA